MVSNSPSVTVVCPYYKRKSVVERTLVSIATQTFGDFEAIIWDDASNDGTWEEIVRVTSLLDDARFRIIKYDKNVGLTNGLNNAIKIAKGRYIAVVGSGDECSPDRLGVQSSLLDGDPKAAFVATASDTVDEKKGDVFKDQVFNGEIIRYSDMRKSVPFTHGSVMFRRDTALALGGYEPTFTWCADWDLFLRFVYPDRYGIYCSDVLYKRYATVDGVSFDPKKSLLQVKSKYLVKMLSGATPELRSSILEQAKRSLDDAVSVYSKNISWDLYKRRFKLVIMGRLEGADELGVLVEKEFGRSVLRNLALNVFGLVRFLPLSSDRLINFFRRFG